MRVRPFPWRSLDGVTRADAAATRILRAWGARHVRLDDVARAATEIVGARVAVRLRRATEMAGDAPPLDAGVAVMLAPADAAHPEHAAAIVELEGALAAALLARALRRPKSTIVDPARAATEAVAGGVAAVAAAIARRAAASAPLRVVDAAPSPTLLPRARAFLAQDDAHLAAAYTVMVEDDAFLARVVVPRSIAASATRAPVWDRARLRDLGATRISIPVVAAASHARAADVAALDVGDAWLPGRWPLAALRGPVLLAAPLADAGLCAELGEGGRLVLTGKTGVVTDDGAAEPTMDTTDALLASIGEVPVVVRVEIGAAEMRARDWAEIGPGDVIALGRRVAEPVVLRVGGVEVARGELVDIEGEVGVRVVERIDRAPREKETTP